jgi:hypothetical protein
MFAKKHFALWLQVHKSSYVKIQTAPTENSVPSFESSTQVLPQLVLRPFPFFKTRRPTFPQITTMARCGGCCV